MKRLPTKVQAKVRTSGQAVHVPLQHIPTHLIEEWVAKFGVHLKCVFKVTLRLTHPYSPNNGYIKPT